jgi:hypothetical protein
MDKDTLDLGVDLRIVQPGGEGAIGITWQLTKVRRRSALVNSPRSNYRMMSRTGSRRLLYAGSPKKSSDVTLSYRTVAARKEIDVKAHQILARRMQRMP